MTIANLLKEVGMRFRNSTPPTTKDLKIFLKNLLEYLHEEYRLFLTYKDFIQTDIAQKTNFVNVTSLVPPPTGEYYIPMTAWNAIPVAYRKPGLFETHVEALYENDTLTITGASGASGIINISLNGVLFPVTITDADDEAAIATKIRNSTYTGWTTGGEEEIVEFYKNAVGVCQAPVLVNAVEKAEKDTLTILTAPTEDGEIEIQLNGETPVVVTLTAITHTTPALVAQAVAAESASFVGWTLTITDATVVFTKDDAGAVTPPYFTDSDTSPSGVTATFITTETGVTATTVTDTFIQTVEGSAESWKVYQNIDSNLDNWLDIGSWTQFYAGGN